MIVAYHIMYPKLTVGNDVDYGSGPYTVTIPAGNQSVVFDISIIDDNMLETNETFELSIDSTSLPSKVFPSRTDRDPSMTTVYIIDDDMPGNNWFSLTIYVYGCLN